MKKHLIALAVAGAVAAPAMAQNVTIYGTLGTAWTSTESNGVTSSDSSNGDNLGSSVFGFSGKEDLGGGLKADFALEMAIKAGTGDQVTAGTFDEKSLVGISGPFGRVSFGRQGTTYDSHKSFGNMGANLFSSTDGELDDLTGPTDETLRYDSPELIKGLSFSVSTSNAAATDDINAAAVTYKAGALSVTYALAESNKDETENSLNIGYKVSPSLQVNAQVMTGEESGKLDQQAWKLGAAYKVSGAFTVLASLQNYTDAGNTRDEDAMGVMGVYSLSKRTALFAGHNIRDIAGSDTTVTTVGVQHKF